MAAIDRVAGRTRGFSMIEVLISIVVLSIGLLGLAGLQVRAQQAENESYQRAQAVMLLADLTDRLRSNARASRCYAVSTTGSGPYVGTNGTDRLDVATFQCQGWGDAESQARAVADIVEWDAALRGSAEKLAGNAVGAMLGARGCVRFDEVAGVYTLSVSWQGLSPTIVPTNGCASGGYGTNDAVRRTIATTVMIPNLE